MKNVQEQQILELTNQRDCAIRLCKALNKEVESLILERNDAVEKYEEMQKFIEKLIFKL